MFSEKNPQAAVRIHWKVFPQSAPREGVTDDAVKQEAEVLKVRVQMQSQNAVGTGRYGDMPIDQIKQVEDYFIATKQVEKTMDPNEYYSNELIEKINAFDHAAIVKLAKEYKGPRRHRGRTGHEARTMTFEKKHYNYGAGQRAASPKPSP